MKDVSGKVAFVTGAASGIGLGICKALARAGAKVMLCDIEDAALARAKQSLEPTDAEIASVRAEGLGGHRGRADQVAGRPLQARL